MKHTRCLIILAILTIEVLIFSSGIVYARGGGINRNRGIRQYGQRLNNFNGENRKDACSQVPEGVQNSMIEERTQKHEAAKKRAAQRGEQSQE